ncbi:anaphase-promoting complex, subunit 10/DOC domain-containing protein [Obelidium mucronatum]|nr:anaphase-promoting complex, subunit 10/DOC domain-containing protein [Obelidium mucronatum]
MNFGLGLKETLNKEALRKRGDYTPRGFGVDCLRDGSIDTYWQSDGPQPHFVNIHFLRKTELQMLRIYLDYRQDESYCPSKISIRAGSTLQDVQELHLLELEEPSGWINVDLRDETTGHPLHAHLVQIAVLSNHQNGKDTHMRQVQLFAPVKNSVLEDIPFSSTEFLMFSTIR